jgi:hypothetical protein
MLEHFALARASDSEVERDIHERLVSTACRFAPVKGIRWPERGAMALSMVCHNVLASTDPLLERWPGRRARATIVDWSEWLLERASAPRTRGEALCRHAIIDRFLSTRREDVVAKSWMFTHRYLGRPVPGGFLTRPRAARMTRTRSSLFSLLYPAAGADADDANEANEELGALIHKLVTYSPVTALLNPKRLSDFRFGTATLAVLSDDLLRNGLARRIVGEGLDVMESYGRALRELYESGAPPRMVYYAFALIFESHVIAILDRAPPQQDLAFGCVLCRALVPALLGAPDDLTALLDLEPPDLERLRNEAMKIDAATPNPVSELAVAIVDYVEPPHLLHERDNPPLPLEVRP